MIVPEDAEFHPHGYRFDEILQRFEKYAAMEAVGPTAVRIKSVPIADEVAAVDVDGVEFFDGRRMSEDAVENTEMSEDGLPGHLKEDASADGPDDGGTFEEGDGVPGFGQQVGRSSPGHAEADDGDAIGPMRK